MAAEGPARYAVYWAPDLDDPLHAAGAAWLGRDPETGACCPQPAIPGLAKLTADPRRYGLHATLKPPFRLRHGRTYADLRQAVERLAASLAGFALPPLAVVDLDGFLALREAAPCPGLHTLANACVIALDDLRASPDAAELARRHAGGLSAAQAALLDRWGYPYVLDCWRFHLTLSQRLAAADHRRLRPAAETHFEASMRQKREVGTITLFTQRAPASPFVIAERYLLGRPGHAG